MVNQSAHALRANCFCSNAFSSPEPTILLACGRNRELWEQPFQVCAIDADYVRPDGQNSVISFVISKWLLLELSIPATGQKDRRLWDENGSNENSNTRITAREYRNHI